MLDNSEAQSGFLFQRFSLWSQNYVPIKSTPSQGINPARNPGAYGNCRGELCCGNPTGFSRREDIQRSKPNGKKGLPILSYLILPVVVAVLFLSPNQKNTGFPKVLTRHLTLRASQPSGRSWKLSKPRQLSKKPLSLTAGMFMLVYSVGIKS